MTTATTCKKPCLWLYIAGVTVITLFTVLFPLWFLGNGELKRNVVSMQGQLERQEVQIVQLLEMSDTLNKHALVLERLTVGVEILARRSESSRSRGPSIPQIGRPGE
jgi:hypothetical protein